MSSEVPAVASAVRILEYLAKEWPQTVFPGTLVEELKLNRSTCYNILGTLEDLGWARGHSASPGWTLGPRLLVITGVTDRSRELVVQGEIDSLSEQLGFIVFAVARERGSYRVTATAERVTGVRVSVGLGGTFPFGAPVIMRTFYAWTELARVEALARQWGLQQFTEDSITDLSALRVALEDVRRCGYSKSLQQYDLGQSGVAASVFRFEGAGVSSHMLARVLEPVQPLDGGSCRGKDPGLCRGDYHGNGRRAAQ
jgi:DNA-binding IclR family transcriptional regulator